MTLSIQPLYLLAQVIHLLVSPLTTHLMPNGQAVGEVVASIHYSQRLIQNSYSGIYQRICSNIVGDWMSQTPSYRANIISITSCCPQPIYYYKTCIVHVLKNLVVMDNHRLCMMTSYKFKYPPEF